MAVIVIYPTAYGFAVLAASACPALTHDAAWRPAHEIANAKPFLDETLARSYLKKYLPDLAPADVVIRVV